MNAANTGMMVSLVSDSCNKPCIEHFLDISEMRKTTQTILSGVSRYTAIDKIPSSLLLMNQLFNALYRTESQVTHCCCSRGKLSLATKTASAAPYIR